MMNEVMYFLLAFITGLVLGALFFGSLWFTVKKAMNAKMPALWIIGSFVFRITITLAGFYFVALGSWQRLAICTLGFVGARMIVMRMIKSSERKKLAQKITIEHEA